MRTQPTVLPGLLLLLLLPAAAGARPDDDAPAPLPPSARFEENPDPVPLEEMPADPLAWASARIGLDLDALELPRAWENSYRAGARFAPVDAVLNRPLHLVSWTDAAYARIHGAHADGGLRAVDEALALLRGTGRWPAPAGALPERLRTVRAELRDWMNGLPLTAEYRAAFGALLDAQLAAQAVLDRALAPVRDADPEGWAALVARPAAMLVPDGKTMPALTGDNAAPLAFFESVRRVDLRGVLHAGRIAAAGTRAYLDATRDWGVERCLSDPQAADRVFTRATSLGRYVLGGFAGDTHREDALVLVDLGGHDVHTHAAGAGRERASLCVDHAGDDRWLRPGDDFVQGFGFLGAGILVDGGGNDRYAAGRFCQGAAIAGTGVLLDADGDDLYDAHAFCQGAGALGLGALLEGGGHDLYDCGTLGQGAATTCGLGLLSDLSGGDRYHLAVDGSKDTLGRQAGHGQGGALSFRPLPWRGEITLYGGAGLLFDGAGDDRYRSKGWCDQGGSYVFSLGALVDAAGNDHYTAHCGQGSGIHVTAAILIDREGHDVYEGEFRCGGSGGDRSAGVFLDLAGNDRYASRTASYGTACKPYAFSLFLDRAGDDTYESPAPRRGVAFNDWDSFGGVWPEGEPWHRTWAVALDLGGDDAYEVRSRGNDSWRHSFGLGVHLDGTWEGDSPLPEAPSPAEPFASLSAADIPASLRGAADPDQFVRLRGAPGATVDELVATLLRSTHRPFNRELLDELHGRLARGALDDRDRARLPELLGAPDAEVRAIAADDLAIWPVDGGVPALRETAGTDPSAAVRRLATRALRLLGDDGAPDLARRLAASDPDAHVRREAVRWLARAPGADDPTSLLASVLADDVDAGVRAAAADGLGRLDAFGARPLLRDHADTGDVYLRRAIGRALCELGDVEGLAVLIDTLSFPSIDAFENYGTNVPNTIAAYAGHDFPEDERYDPRRWRRWFERHRDGLDVRRNAEAARALAELGRITPDEFARAEALLERYPDWPRLRTALAAALNRHAWTAVTAPEGSDARDVERGLAWARRAVALHDHRNHVDTLAEALWAAGETAEAARVCREALARWPGEAMFTERLARIGDTGAGDG